MSYSVSTETKKESKSEILDRIFNKYFQKQRRTGPRTWTQEELDADVEEEGEEEEDGPEDLYPGMIYVPPEILLQKLQYYGYPIEAFKFLVELWKSKLFNEIIIRLLNYKPLFEYIKPKPIIVLYIEPHTEGKTFRQIKSLSWGIQEVTAYFRHIRIYLNFFYTFPVEMLDKELDKTIFLPTYTNLGRPIELYHPDRYFEKLYNSDEIEYYIRIEKLTEENMLSLVELLNKDKVNNVWNFKRILNRLENNIKFNIIKGEHSEELGYFSIIEPVIFKMLDYFDKPELVEKSMVDIMCHACWLFGYSKFFRERNFLNYVPNEHNLDIPMNLEEIRKECLSFMEPFRKLHKIVKHPIKISYFNFKKLFFIRYSRNVKIESLASITLYILFRDHFQKLLWDNIITIDPETVQLINEMNNHIFRAFKLQEGEGNIKDLSVKDIYFFIETKEFDAHKHKEFMERKKKEDERQKGEDIKRVEGLL